MAFVNLLQTAAVSAVLLSSTAAQNASIVSIPYELTYLLPSGYSGNLSYTFENSTRTSNGTINKLLRSASQAPFVAYDPEFLDIIGANPHLKLIEAESGVQVDDFAYEAGVWVPSTNEVWFTSASEQPPAHVSILNLETNAIRRLNTTGVPFTNPNGAYYHNDTVTFACFRDNTTFRGGLLNVNPHTYEVTTVVNSYFGLPFGSPDDPVWVTRNNKSYLFFTDLNFDHPLMLYDNIAPAPLPRGIWRFDPQQQLLSYVISRTDIAVPNGIRVSPDQRTLYITDFGTQMYSMDAGNAGMSSPSIYKYDLDEDVMPVNRQIFGLVRDGGADGLHVDDAGRVWTGESSGITVRAPDGKVLGSFNSQVLLASQSASIYPIANFALAGNTLIILAVDRLYRVKLAQTLVSAKSSIVD